MAKVVKLGGRKTYKNTVDDEESFESRRTPGPMSFARGAVKAAQVRGVKKRRGKRGGGY